MFPDCLHADRNVIYKQGKESRTQNAPLLTPKEPLKKSATLLCTRTQETTALMAFKNGPDNPAFTNVRNKDARSTESKAFLRSMNAAYNFPPVLLKYFSVVADMVYIYGLW